MRRRATLRSTALLFAGAAVVHELRYALAYGDAERVTGHQGHAYLALLTPALGLLLAVALAQLVVRSLSPAQRPPNPRTSFARTWGVVSTALTGTYVAQELVEGWATAHHADAVNGILTNGGWAALPLALAVGAVITLAMRAARRLEGAAPAGLAAARWTVRGVVEPVLRHAAPDPGAGRVIAGALVARGPPVAA